MIVGMRRGCAAVAAMLAAAAATAGAQAPLTPEAAAAYEELAPRFASEAALIQGWFRDRVALYYDFGVVPPGIAPARVYWPIHGFDARRNPVAIRGQRPIFSTIPGLPDYSGVYRLIYVVTADKVQPNELKDPAAIEAAIRARRALLSETNLTLNLPITARGSTLARDSSGSMMGWYQGRDVQFFDFGPVSMTPAPMWRFLRARDAEGQPIMVEGQNGILDSIPVAPTYPDLWDIRWVRVDSTYAANTIKSAVALRATGFAIDSATMIRNLPVTIVDGVAIARVASPLREFADMRSAFPPKPTPPLDVR